jgi:subtilase family serine protease
MSESAAFFRFLSVGLLISATSGAAWADSHSHIWHVGGPLQDGRGRPPLHLNLTPAASTSYAPAQIRHAYGIDALATTGTGQTIAIVDAYGSPTLQADLNTFCAHWGLPSTTVQIIGGSSTADTGWALETALDVEWAHAAAPGARIVLSVARSSSTSDLLAAVDAAVNAGARVVSMSWGGGESSRETLYDIHFNRLGVTFIASSGDDGAGVEWPATSSYVLAVGGTSLTLDANSNRLSEVGWSGSGGGTSAVINRPSYQNGWTSAKRRGSPDVSMVADPNTGLMVYDAGTWYVVGGTSAGAPIWTGVVALSNSLRIAGTLNSANTALYGLARNSSVLPYSINARYFYDPKAGSNGGYSASGGYDFVTGLGSPVVNALVGPLSTK